MKFVYLLGFGIVLCFYGCSNQSNGEMGSSVQSSGIESLKVPNIPPAKQETKPEDPPKHSHAQEANEMMNHHGFDDLVGFMESPERIKWQRPDEVIASLGDLNGKKVMDLGAGTGYFAFRLKNAGADVVAAEVDERFLHFLEHKRDSLEIPQHEFEVRRVFYDDPLLNQSELDVFFTVDTYHHIEHRDKYLKKVFEGLKQGGSIVVVDFKKMDTPHGPPAKIRVEAEKIMAELAKAGFDSVRVDADLLPEQNVIYGLRLN